jgi:hypothetical protein
MIASTRFRVGERVKLARDLTGLRTESEGFIRGALAKPGGVSSAVRFEKSMRIVAERDLSPPSSTGKPPRRFSVSGEGNLRSTPNQRPG